MNVLRPIIRSIGLAVLALGAQAAHAGSDVTLTFTNLAPSGGVGVAPLWVGFHNGSFDTFNVGAGASAALEHAAEDGNGSFLNSSFSNQVAGGVSTILPGGPR